MTATQPKKPAPKPDPKPDPIAFNLKAPRYRIPTTTLLAAVKAFAASVGHRPFTVPEFQRWELRPISAATIIARFGSWRSALARAGVKDAQGRDYPPDELIERLERAWKMLSRPPGRHTLARLVNISTKPYSRHWGSLSNACAQLARYHAGKITRAQLLRPLPTRPRRPIRPSLRFAILRRDRHTCQSCGRAAPNVKLEVDHITPVRKGGQNTPKNLRTLCQPCNRGKA